MPPLWLLRGGRALTPEVIVKTLALRNGDLIISGAGHQTIEGSPKIRQELAIALSEGYGNDKYHPTWGSILDEFFGRPVNELTQSEIVAEISRVINAYIAIQQQEVLNDHMAQRASRFNTDDVVTGIVDINANLSYDTIYVTVVLATASGTNITVNRTVQQ